MLINPQAIIDATDKFEDKMFLLGLEEDLDFAVRLIRELRYANDYKDELERAREKGESWRYDPLEQKIKSLIQNVRQKAVMMLCDSE